MFSSPLLLRLGGHASACECGGRTAAVCNAHVPRSGSGPAPHSRGHGFTLPVPPATGFLFRPGDPLKVLPPLSRLHRPLKIPHSAVAHAAVLGRMGKSVRPWEPSPGFGTTRSEVSSPVHESMSAEERAASTLRTTRLKDR